MSLQKRGIFRLSKPTLGVDLTSGGESSGCIFISAGDIVRLVSESDADRFVEVMWNDKRLRIFAVDLVQRGEELDSANLDEWLDSQPRV